MTGGGGDETTGVTETAWDHLPADVQRALAGAFQADVPRLAVAFYAPGGSSRRGCASSSPSDASA